MQYVRRRTKINVLVDTIGRRKVDTKVGTYGRGAETKAAIKDLKQGAESL